MMVMLVVVDVVGVVDVVYVVDVVVGVDVFNSRSCHS